MRPPTSRPDISTFTIKLLRLSGRRRAPSRPPFPKAAALPLTLRSPLERPARQVLRRLECLLTSSPFAPAALWFPESSAAQCSLTGVGRLALQERTPSRTKGAAQAPRRVASLGVPINRLMAMEPPHDSAPLPKVGHRGR